MAAEHKWHWEKNTKRTLCGIKIKRNTFNFYPELVDCKKCVGRLREMGEEV